MVNSHWAFSDRVGVKTWVFQAIQCAVFQDFYHYREWSEFELENREILTTKEYLYNMNYLPIQSTQMSYFGDESQQVVLM